MNGRELKAKIQELGVTQKVISEKLDIKQQSLSSMLSANDVRSSTIERISKAVGCPISYLYGEDNKANVLHESGNQNKDVLTTKLVMLEKLLQEKDKMIEEKERTINILLNKNKATR